jgi:peptidyl-prolyl cis-trans isomerase B (cyclophilin B)
MSRKKKKKQGQKKNDAAPRRAGWLFPLLGAALVLAAASVVWALPGGFGNVNDNEHEGAQYMNQPKPVVTIEMESGAVIRVELDPVNAPNTVRNFIALAEGGFYDGLIFHRVIPGFMIQGGCPRGAGTGGPGYSIRGEFTANNFENKLPHARGVISMARSQPYNSAGSQFFITVAAASHLDGNYAAFGRVIEGMEEADRIAAVQRDRSDRPLEEQRIRKVTVDTFGVAYDPPEKM